jgi:hypothetical protein
VPLDRPVTFGWLVGHDAKLADRLVRAVEAQAVFTSPRVRTDSNGKTYVEATCHVFGKRMSADRRRLGY